MEAKKEFCSRGDENGNEDDGENEFEEGTQRENKKGAKASDVRFEAYVIQDQRILDTDDDITRFDDTPSQTDSSPADQTPKGAERGIQRGGWQFQNQNRVKQKIKQIIRRELCLQEIMSEEEASQVRVGLLRFFFIPKNCTTCISLFWGMVNPIIYSVYAWETWFQSLSMMSD